MYFSGGSSIMYCTNSIVTELYFARMLGKVEECVKLESKLEVKVQVQWEVGADWNPEWR